MLRTNPNAVNELSKKGGMIWHYILMLILLVISAFNFFYGSRMLGGSHYGSSAEAETIYFYFPGLKTADTVFGWYCVALATMGFVLIYLLYRKKKKGPFLLPFFFILYAVGQVLYLAAVLIVLSGSTGNSAALMKESVVQLMLGGVIGQVVLTVASSVTMIIVNKIYYNKRKEQFS